MEERTQGLPRLLSPVEQRKPLEISIREGSSVFSLFLGRKAVNKVCERVSHVLARERLGQSTRFLCVWLLAGL